MICCYVCGDFETTLYRQNEKGVKGVFACVKHNICVIDPEVLEVTDALEGREHND